METPPVLFNRKEAELRADHFIESEAYRTWDREEIIETLLSLWHVILVASETLFDSCECKECTKVIK